MGLNMSKDPNDEREFRVTSVSTTGHPTTKKIIGNKNFRMYLRQVDRETRKDIMAVFCYELYDTKYYLNPTELKLPESWVDFGRAP